MSLYATLFKLKIQKARARIKTNFWGEGSILSETVQSCCRSVESVLEIESDEEPAKIAKLARVSESGCYVIQALRSPTPVSYRVLLNGQELDHSRTH